MKLPDAIARGTTGLKTRWIRFWLGRSGPGLFGRIATRLGAWPTPPYTHRFSLAELSKRGYVAASATLSHPGLRMGRHVFVGDRVLIFQSIEGGPVELQDRVHLVGDITIQTGQGGSVKIGSDTYIQPRCQFSAYLAPIEIGCGVQIAPACAFYPYDHGFAPGELIRHQPLNTKGGIVVDDDALLGYGVIVLSGVRIGKGAVIGAGSVVTRDVPDGAIAAGVPCRIMRMRSDPAQKGVAPSSKRSFHGRRTQDHED